MAIINKVMMLVSQPNGVWEKIIMAFNSNIANYALAIMCLTLVIKLIMFPIDFFNRKFTRKSSRVQAECQPEIEVIKKKYANNPKEINEKTMEIYKKHNYNVGGTCLVTLISMALTLFVFITLFSGLNKMSAFKVSQQYEDIRVAYYNVETVDDITQAKIDEIAGSETLIAQAKERALEKYNQEKESFLWIENIWIADSPFENPVPTFDKYSKLAGLSEDAKTDEAKLEYEKIYSVVDENVRNQNGYFGVTILIIAFAFTQQFFMNKKYSFKRKKVTDNEVKEKKMPANKIMLVVLPLVLGIIAIFYNSVFGLYMIISSVFANLTTPLINNILDISDKKEKEKKKQKEKLTYSRK